MNAKIWSGVAILVLLAAGVGWRLSLPPAYAPASSPSIAPGAVAANELAGHHRPASIPTPDVPATTDLATADRALDLHGEVVDAAGHGVPGASIETSSYPWQQASVFNMFEREHGVPGATTRSARDGTFRLRLTRGAVVDVRATAEGKSARTIRSCQAGERVHMVLGAGTSLVVEVVNEAGTAVGGADVRYFRDARLGLERIEEHGITGEDGRVTFSELPDGAFGSVDVRHPDYGTPAWTRGDTVAGTTAKVHIVMPTGRTVRGVVLDAIDGKPIAQARVGLGWTLARAVTTDATGHFELRGYTGKFYMGFCATAIGYDASNVVYEVPTDVPLTIRLERGARLIGRVVREDGRPMAGALVGITGGASRANGIYATADADGRFVLLGVAKGTMHTLFLSASEAGRTLLDLDVPADSDVMDLGDVTIDAPAPLTVIVTREDGSPATGTRVEVTGWNADRDRLRPGAPSVDLGRQGTNANRRTDDLGRALFADLAAGQYRVEAQPLGAKWVAKDVTVPRSGDGTDVRLQLVGRRSLAVRVVDEVGAGVGGAEVSAVLDDGYSIGRTCDATGTARFVGDRPFARVEVSFGIMGGTPHYLTPPPRLIGADERDVTVVAARAEIVRGRVVDLEGKPEGGVALEAFCDGKPLMQLSPFSGNSLFSDPDGWFEVIFPPDAEVSVRARPEMRADKGFVGGGVDHVRAGATDLVLRRRLARLDRSLSVHVVGPDGRPAAGIQVFARVSGQDVPGANVVTDARGVAQLSKLPDVAVVVSVVALASSPERASWTRWDSPPTEPTGGTLEAVLRLGRVVEGRVLDHSGEPVGHCLMSVVSPDGILASAYSDAEGRYRLVIRPDAARPWSLGGASDTAVGNHVLVEPAGEPVDLHLDPSR